jgi:hypothetical protein
MKKINKNNKYIILTKINNDSNFLDIIFIIILFNNIQEIKNTNSYIF